MSDDKRPHDMTAKEYYESKGVKFDDIPEETNTPEVVVNPEDEVIAQIDEFLSGYEGTPLEDFVNDVNETLKAKYGPGFMTEKYDFKLDHDDIFDGALADIDQVRPSKLEKFVDSEEFTTYVVYAAAAGAILWNVRSIVKIAKDLRA